MEKMVEYCCANHKNHITGIIESHMIALVYTGI